MRLRSKINNHIAYNFVLLSLTHVPSFCRQEELDIIVNHNFEVMKSLYPDKKAMIMYLNKAVEDFQIRGMITAEKDPVFYDSLKNEPFPKNLLSALKIHSLYLMQTIVIIFIAKLILQILKLLKRLYDQSQI